MGDFVLGELGPLPKRGDMVQANGYSPQVEAVRKNRIEAGRILDHHARGEDGPTRLSRPVKEAAATPRGQEQQAGGGPA